MFFQLVILCFLCTIWRFWRKKPSTLEPPELSGSLPIVGHAYLGFGGSIKLYNTFKKYTEKALKMGGVATFKAGPLTFYAVADPEDSLTLMNSCLQKSYIYNFMKQLFGNGLILADEATWQNHRKLLNPAFNQKVLDEFIEIFNTQAQSLVDQFRIELGKPFDHENLLRINNLETICSTSAGIDASEYNDLRQEYVLRYENVNRRFAERVGKLWLHMDFIYNMTQEKKKEDEDTNYIIELSKSIIHRKKSEKKIRPENKNRKFKPFMDLLLDLASETGCFTDEEIREETDNIIAGGHDTTAILLTFALTVLGSNPEMQEKAYKEILLVLGNTKKHIDKDDLSKLQYIEAVLKETLRLYPVAPFIGRWIDKDVKLKNFTLKANTNCLISIYGINRHKMWGPDADQFHPERWLDKETLPDSKYFGAFGMGRRACIGKVYAMMSMKITLAHVLRKYRISSDVSKMVEKFELLARPVSGHFITLALR